MGRDANDWVSVLEPGRDRMVEPGGGRAATCATACHDPVFPQEPEGGDHPPVTPRFLDTEVNFSTWCNGRDELLDPQNAATAAAPGCRRKPAGITARPRLQRQRPAGRRHHGVRLHQLVSFRTNTSAPCASIISHDDGETWEKGPLLYCRRTAISSGSRRLCLPAGRHHPHVHAHLSGQYGLGRGRATVHLVSYTAESRDGGVTWTQAGALHHPQQRVEDRRHQLGRRHHPDGLQRHACGTDWHERSPLTLACTRRTRERPGTTLCDTGRRAGQQMPARHVQGPGRPS